MNACNALMLRFRKNVHSKTPQFNNPTGYNFLNWYLTLRSFHYSLYVTVYCPGDVHWARLEASALGSLIAAAPHGREENPTIWLIICCLSPHKSKPHCSKLYICCVWLCSGRADDESLCGDYITPMMQIVNDDCV